MSGSGGFYKYRCKYFYSHECPNWVYVNNTACAACAAEGRDIEPAPSRTPAMGCSQQILLPIVEGGALSYAVVEVATAPSDTSGKYWAARYTVDQQTQTQVPTTTCALPGTPVTTTSM